MACGGRSGRKKESWAAKEEADLRIPLSFIQFQLMHCAFCGDLELILQSSVGFLYHLQAMKLLEMVSKVRGSVQQTEVLPLSTTFEGLPREHQLKVVCPQPAIIQTYAGMRVIHRPYSNSSSGSQIWNTYPGGHGRFYQRQALLCVSYSTFPFDCNRRWSKLLAHVGKMKGSLHCLLKCLRSASVA